MARGRVHRRCVGDARLRPSNSTGIAAFPNNEAFRLGSTEPTFFVPRAFFRQTFALSADTVPGEGDALRFVEPLPRERITLTVGKVSVWDIFDRNRYSHDARTQFMNWALVGAGGMDYAADARGLTEGAAVEWDDGAWGLRGGAFRVARRVNGLFLDPAPTRAWQVLGEVDRFYRVNGRPGAARVISTPRRAPGSPPGASCSPTASRLSTRTRAATASSTCWR